jgi:tRNA threonylcarbamoyl adenosine modification protein YeaZ
MSDGRLLLIETATRHAVVGLADADGTLVAAEQWQSVHRHGEELLPRLNRLFAESRTERAALAAVVVGTGPGSFTGLRIGLATAKTIGHTLGVPVVGLPTMQLLAHAAAAAEAANERPLAIVMPAGVGDRYIGRYQVTGDVVRELAAPTLVAAAAVRAQMSADDRLVAVDLAAGELEATAEELGRQAQSGLAAALAAEGAKALAAGKSVDVAELVPQYVALPRGVPASSEEMAWSPDLR